MLSPPFTRGGGGGNSGRKSDPFSGVACDAPSSVIHARDLRFYGVIIRMFFDDHLPPHFHAVYGSEQAEISIQPIRLLKGGLPPRAMSMVIEWAGMLQLELLENWRRLHANEPIQRVAPLE